MKEQISHSPRPDSEAEWMALWIGGEVVAHDTLYEKLKNAAALVRNTFRNEVPSLDSISFTPFWFKNGLDIYLTQNTVNEIRAGSYHEWDELNELFRATVYDTSFGEICDLYFARLSFEARLNPVPVGSLYQALGGVSMPASGRTLRPIEATSVPGPSTMDSHFSCGRRGVIATTDASIATTGISELPIQAPNL